MVIVIDHPGWVIQLYLASHIFVVCIFCTLRFMSANLSKGNFFSRNIKPFRKYTFQMLSFYIRQYFDRDDEDKDLNKDTLSGYWAREEEYLQMFTDMNSSSQIDFSSFKSANIPYGFRKLCQKSSKTHWQILSRFKIHSKAYQQRKRVNLRIFVLKPFFFPTVKSAAKAADSKRK